MNDKIVFKPKIIIAPSAAGKSFYCRRDSNLLDGDVIIDKYDGWPKEQLWWLNISSDDRNLLARHVDILYYEATMSVGKIIMYNPIDVAAFCRKFEVFFFLPSERVHRLNCKRRKEEGNSVQPSDWQYIVKNRNKIVKFAKIFRAPLYEDFNMLIKTITI